MESDCWREPLFQLVSHAVETAPPPNPWLYYLEDFGRTDQGGQGRGECCGKDPCSDEGAEPWHHAHDLEKREGFR